jgi:hypothetical protein
MKYTLSLAILLVLLGCSREQVSSASGAAAKSYNETYRDNVIMNWQARVSTAPACMEFKNRFVTAGERYDNAANGSFAQDMIKIWDATKAAGCNAPV